MKREKFPLWFVRWQDASHPRGEWQSVDGAESETLEVNTIGFLVCKSREWLTLAATVAMGNDGAPEQFAAEMHIPRSCVTSILELPRDGREARVVFSRKTRKKP